MIWIIVAIIFGFLFSLAYASASGAPWVPTFKRDIKRLAKLLELKPGDKFYELGCGDGRVCFALAKQTKIKAVGIELSLLQYLIGKLRQWLSCSTRVQIKYGNVFNQDLSEADVIYLFLMPEVYQKIRTKFETELKDGARVVSYVWPIPGWEPTQVDKHLKAPNLFLYKIRKTPNA
ncbi:SAM-dependent methyltransferase [Patescibacteria group bacterium]